MQLLPEANRRQGVRILQCRFHSLDLHTSLLERLLQLQHPLARVSLPNRLANCSSDYSSTCNYAVFLFELLHSGAVLRAGSSRVCSTRHLRRSSGASAVASGQRGTCSQPCELTDALDQVSAHHEAVLVRGNLQFELHFHEQKLGGRHRWHRSDAMQGDQVLQTQKPLLHSHFMVNSQVQSAAHEEQTEAAPRRIFQCMTPLKCCRHWTVRDTDALAQVHTLRVLVLGSAPTQLLALVRAPEEASGAFGVRVVVLVHRETLLHHHPVTFHLGLLGSDGSADGIVPTLCLCWSRADQDVLSLFRHLAIDLDHNVGTQ
mmetsp:Transcript_138212/g.441631  ORF Transcript_138212/g.441631 Transcript_138212/m.441631 type:complete len:316 (+) Transcript_138212:1877-2824(+)